jgi:hypothetical protein
MIASRYSRRISPTRTIVSVSAIANRVCSVRGACRSAASQDCIASKKSDLDSKPPPFWTRLAIRLTALHHCPNFTTQPLSWFRHDQEHRFSRFAFVEESAPAINNKNLAVSYNCRVSALSEQF